MQNQSYQTMMTPLYNIHYFKYLYHICTPANDIGQRCDDITNAFSSHAMACPMRFVLAGVSAILAFFLIWKNSNTTDCEDSHSSDAKVRVKAFRVK